MTLRHPVRLNNISNAVGLVSHQQSHSITVSATMALNHFLNNNHTELHSKITSTIITLKHSLNKKKKKMHLLVKLNNDLNNNYTQLHLTIILKTIALNDFLEYNTGLLIITLKNSLCDNHTQLHSDSFSQQFAHSITVSTIINLNNYPQ